MARTVGRDSSKRNLRDCSETMSSAWLLPRRHVGQRSFFLKIMVGKTMVEPATFVNLFVWPREEAQATSSNISD